MEPPTPTSSSSTTVLHSPLSPLSPGSPIHPDGVLTPQWNVKHQHIVPAVFVSFFSWHSDPQSDTLRDNQLKNELSSIRTSIEMSHYGTRQVTVLVGDDSTLHPFNASDLDDRIASIKKGSKLDGPGLFFLRADSTPEDIDRLVSSFLISLKPLCAEYYRDLTRHARRKRDKNANPTTTTMPGWGKIQGLPRKGWVARYEYKLGVFAEFRDEVQVAERHYAEAIDFLCAPAGPYSKIMSLSPRWTEVRQLSDMLALRLIRCQLAMNLPTTALLTWRQHFGRTLDLVRSRGKGDSNYGWKAWQAIWAKVMAELVIDSHILNQEDGQEVDKTKPYEASNMIYTSTDKLSEPDLLPWHYLHHPGYWLLKSATFTRERRDLARDITEEDRIPPGQSPASKVTRRSENYDTYLCPDPHVEYDAATGNDGMHVNDIVSTLDATVQAFGSRAQNRFAQYVQLTKCQELIKAERFAEALEVLQDIWKHGLWREGGWFRLVAQVTDVLWTCASTLDDFKWQVATSCELVHRSESVLRAVHIPLFILFRWLML